MGTPEGGSRYEARGDDLEIKGELYLCLLVTFFVNALTSAVVTERVPINTNFSLLLQATVLSVPTPLGPASLSV